MTDQHPITPPSNLIYKWEGDILNERDNVDHVLDCAWQNGFQAGADAELEACCEWMADETPTNYINALRATRRPKPPSLKEQALAKLPEQPENMASHLKLTPGDVATIRRALEALDD